MNPVIQQIQALLQKTVENGCTEAEAASAAAVAQKLLVKHRLSLIDVQEKTSPFGRHYSDGSLETGKAIPHWKRALFTAVCTANGCISGLSVSRSGVGNSATFRLEVMGTEEDAALVAAFYCNLRDMVSATAKRLKPPSAGGRWGNSFKWGMVAAISGRLKESVQASEKEATSTALVRLKDQTDAVMAWAKNEFGESRSLPKPNLNPEAFAHGVFHGRQANLSKKVLA